jgi:hypothetical protein
MTFSIGAFSCSLLTAQPLGYEGDARQGLTARTWRISGLLTTAQWQSLLSVYDTWQAARIQDPDTLTSNSVGTTVSFTGSANGVSWSGISCWFSEAPSGEQVGAYVQASVTLVHAAEALAVLRKDQLLGAARFYFGTYTLGSTTLQLLKPAETYQDTPSLALTASGATYITGPLSATRVRQIEGDTNAAGWAAIQSWYESAIAATPAAGAWFPISAPSATAEAQIVGGVRADLYTVSISLGQAK